MKFMITTLLQIGHQTLASAQLSRHHHCVHYQGVLTMGFLYHLNLTLKACVECPIGLKIIQLNSNFLEFKSESSLYDAWMYVCVTIAWLWSVLVVQLVINISMLQRLTSTIWFGLEFLIVSLIHWSKRWTFLCCQQSADSSCLCRLILVCWSVNCD